MLVNVCHKPKEEEGLSVPLDELRRISSDESVSTEIDLLKKRRGKQREEKSEK